MSLRARKLLAYGAALLVLLAVFALYTQPAMMVALSDAMWACFSIVR
jgi:hypothetical protein